MSKLVQLKDSEGNIFPIPKIEYSGNQSNTITVTPKYDCYIKVEAMRSTWGYDGREFNVEIVNTAGSATAIYNLKAHAYGGNVIARSMFAKALFLCNKNITYTFSTSGGTYSDTNTNWITAEIIPR